MTGPGAGVQATFWPGGRIPADGHVALWGPADLAAAVAELGAPPGTPARLPTVAPASARARRKVTAADVDAVLLPMRPAIRLLAGLAAPDAWPPWQRPSDSVLAWSVAAKLALEHVAAGNIVPTLRPAGPDAMVAGWRLAAARRNAADGRFATLAAAMPPAAHALRRDEDDDTVWTAADLLAAFADAVADTCARAPKPDARRNRNGAAAPGDVGARWVAALDGTDPVVTVAAESTEGADDVARWTAPLTGTGPQAARLCVQLHTPAAAAPDEPWPLDYLLQAADEPSLIVPAEHVWQTGSRTLEAVGGRLVDPQEALVRGLAEAARLFTPIDASLSEPSPTRLALAPADAAAFLTDGAGALAAAGLGVMLPAELTAKGARKLRARLRMGAPVGDPGAGITGAGLDADALGAFRWEAAIGDDSLTADEFAEIVALKQPLVLWKGQWVRLDPDEAVALADLVGPGGEGGQLEAAEALAAALAGERADGDLGPVEVVADGVLLQLVDRLRTARDDRAPRLVGVDATLRAYQGTGVAWLQALGDLGSGRCSPTTWASARRCRPSPCSPGGPATAPTSSCARPRWSATGSASWPASPRPSPCCATTAPTVPTDPSAFPAGTVVVTTYGLLRRDADLLAEVDVGRGRARRGPADQEPRGPHRPGSPAAHRDQPGRPHRHPGREPAVRAVVDHGVRQPGPARVVRPVPRALRRAGRALARPRRRRPPPPRRGAVHAAAHQDRPGHRGRPAPEDRGHRRLHAHPRAGHPLPGGGAHAARPGRPRRGHRAPRPHPQAAHRPQADLQPPGAVPRRGRAAAPGARASSTAPPRCWPRWSTPATAGSCSPSTARWASCWSATSRPRWGWRPSRSCTAGSPGAAGTRWSPGSRTGRRRRS